MRRFVIVLSCLALLSAGMVGCGDDGETNGGNNIVIGLLAAFSGTLSGMGPGFQNTAAMAVDEINKAGGLGGGKYKLQLEKADDATDPAVAPKGAKSLVDKKAVAIIGPTSSGTAQAAIDANLGITYVSASATSPSLTDGTPSFFRTAPSDAFQGVVAADYAAKPAPDGLGLKTAAVLYIDNSYGKGLAEYFKDQFEKLTTAGSVKAMVAYPDMDEKTLASYDFSTDATTLFADKPEVVFLITYFDDGAKFTSEAKNHISTAYTPTILGCDGNWGQDFLDKADAAVIDKMVGTAPAAPEGDANYSYFAGAYKTKFNADADAYSESVYDAVYLVAYALEAWLKDNPGKMPDKSALPGKLLDLSRPNAAGDDKVINANKWKEGIDEIAKSGDINYEGASGAVDWDDNGDPTNGFYQIWKVENKAFVKVKTVSASTGD